MKPTSVRPPRKLSPIMSSPKSSKPSKTFTLPTAKKAKIIYKEEPKILIALHIKGVAPLRTNKLLEDIEAFYKELKAKPDLLTPLNKLKITAEHIETQLTALADVKQAEATYVLERGESQQATKDKDTAFAAFEKWVREFYAIAKIALEDKPQLLESIGKFVRS